MKKRFGALLLATALLCGLASCGDRKGPADSAPPGGEQTLDVDVVIVGAGGAGMTAGITAARAGKKVVILEKMSTVGGNSARATGGMNAAKTEWQDDSGWSEFASVENTLNSAADIYPELSGLVDAVQKEYDNWKATGYNGYFDSVGLFILDTMVAGKNSNDLELVTTLAENSAGAVDWLETVGAHLPNVVGFSGSSVKRSHRPINDEGKTVSIGSYLMPLLEQACIDNAVDILLNAPVTEILMADGRAVGVKAEGYTVNAKSVILATGGFGADLETVADWRPELKDFVTTNAPGCTGDGFRMAQAVGADVVDMEQILVHPTVEQATATPISDSLWNDGAILVNAEGLRFCDETDTPDVVSAAILDQAGGSAWLVVDQRMMDPASPIAEYISQNCTVQNYTYSGLAKAMGVPEEALSETMDKWNEAMTNGRDEAFGRTGFAVPSDSAPFYAAIQVVSGVLHTMGGVKINTFAEVLEPDGAAIPGLFAAGEVTGGIHGAGCLDGNGLTDAVVFGRVAGESAATYAE